jgi:hypothetical protein
MAERHGSRRSSWRSITRNHSPWRISKFRLVRLRQTRKSPEAFPGFFVSPVMAPMAVVIIGPTVIGVDRGRNRHRRGHNRLGRSSRSSEVRNMVPMRHMRRPQAKGMMASRKDDEARQSPTVSASGMRPQSTAFQLSVALWNRRTARIRPTDHAAYPPIGRVVDGPLALRQKRCIRDLPIQSPSQGRRPRLRFGHRPTSGAAGPGYWPIGQRSR